MLEYLIGIKNLPNAATKMVAGRLYAVVYNDACSGLGLVCRTLVAAGASGRAVWLAEDNPGRAFDLPSSMAGEMRQGVEKGNILVFETGGKKHARLGRLMLEELSFLEIRKGSLLVIEGADRILEADAPETWDAIVSSWQRWAEHSGSTLLWMFPVRVGHIDPELDIVQIAHRCSGYARMRKTDNEVCWDIFHWFGTEGLISDKSFRLSVPQDKPWRVEPAESLPGSMSGPAADENEVFITYAALAGASSTPAGWRVLETLDQMTAALSTATAATAVFHYNSHTPLEVLARTVFGLRRAIGSRIKIAVRETDVRLRHSHEQLLLNLGVNLIIPAGTSFSRMLNLLETVQGQVFSRPLQDDYESTIASVMPVAKMGYLAPEQFVESVSEAQHRARALSIHNVLIRFPLTAGLGALETLHCCTMKRPGDFFTADDGSLYLFLFACEEEDIGQTLDRLFRLPVSVLFADELRNLTFDDIAETVADLGRRATETIFPDFTADLAANPNNASAMMDTLLPSNTTVQGSVRLATPAMRQPLKLRLGKPRKPRTKMQKDNLPGQDNTTT